MFYIFGLCIFSVPDSGFRFSQFNSTPFALQAGPVLKPRGYLIPLALQCRGPGFLLRRSHFSAEGPVFYSARTSVLCTRFSRSFYPARFQCSDVRFAGYVFYFYFISPLGPLCSHKASHKDSYSFTHSFTQGFILGFTQCFIQLHTWPHTRFHTRLHTMFHTASHKASHKVSYTASRKVSYSFAPSIWHATGGCDTTVRHCVGACPHTTCFSLSCQNGVVST